LARYWNASRLIETAAFRVADTNGHKKRQAQQQAASNGTRKLRPHRCNISSQLDHTGDTTFG